jgi:hypothetical protein
MPLGRKRVLTDGGAEALNMCTVGNKVVEAIVNNQAVEICQWIIREIEAKEMRGFTELKELCE